MNCIYFPSPLKKLKPPFINNKTQTSNFTKFYKNKETFSNRKTKSSMSKRVFRQTYRLKWH